MGTETQNRIKAFLRKNGLSQSRENIVLLEAIAAVADEGTINTDVISELTAGAGVTVDGVLLKDGGAVFADAATIEIDTVNEATTAAGVTVDGVLVKDGGIVMADGAAIDADIINEATAAAGVTADGVLLKDGGVVLTKGTVTQLTAITTGVTVNAPAGVITTVSSTLAAGSNATFIVTNSFATATSVVQLTVDDSATAGLAKLNVQSVGAGVFSVNVTNIHSANAFNNTLDIYFAIL